jgi:predicted porin
MKKLLIATAALAMVAGTVQAQSSVTVYGVLDIGYGQTKFDDGVGGFADRKVKNTGNGDGGLATSRLGFRGTEDLGGGLKANFMVEWDLTDVGSGGGAASSTATGEGRVAGTMGARESWVGFSDSWGELKLGRQVTGSHGVVAGFSAGFANNTVGAIYSAGPSGTQLPQEMGIRPHNVYGDRLISYTTPNMSGFQATVQYGETSVATNGATVNDSSKFTDLSARYTQGKLALGAAMQKREISSTAAYTGPTVAGGLVTVVGTAAPAANLGSFYAGDIPAAALAANSKITYETTSAGVSYDFGFVRPFVLHTTQTADSSVAAAGEFLDRSATEIGVRAPLGKATLFASMFDGEYKYGANARTKDDVSGYQLGVTYDLSKRTALYAITGKHEQKGTGADTYKAKLTGTSMGVRHSF